MSYDLARRRPSNPWRAIVLGHVDDKIIAALPVELQ